MLLMYEVFGIIEISGKFLRGGVPDAISAARSLLNDWNTGKIKYCTQPPEILNTDSTHISASIVSEDAREFEVDNFDEMETDVLKNFTEKIEDLLDFKSTGPVAMSIEQSEEQNELDDKCLTNKAHIIEESEDEEISEPSAKRTRGAVRAKKVDAIMLIEGK